MEQNKFILSCNQATEFIEKNESKQLSFGNKLRLKMHVSICKACRLYIQQSKKISSMLEKHGNISMSLTNQDLKNKIISKLK